MSAASRATSVPPWPIATPISACRRAGASLTPSPVIATLWPVGLQGAHDPDLLLGIHPGVDADPADDLGQLGVVELAQGRAR